MTMLPADVATEEPSTATTPEAPGKVIEGRSLGQIAWSRLRRDRVAMVSLGVAVLICLAALFAPLLSKMLDLDPLTFYSDAIDVDSGALPKGGFLQSGVSTEHPLGVEPGTGRDILARLLYGARISLMISLLATLISVALGVVFGAMAGYFRGKVDAVISRAMDLLLAFPQLLLLIALTPVLEQRLVSLGFQSGNGTRIPYLIFVIGFFGWPYFGRIIRGQVLSLREREFVDAARSLGAGSGHIIFRQLLPNLWASILVYATLIIPSYIGLEAALSFLGVGIIEPTPSWGKMLADSVSFANNDPLYLFIPGTALFLVVLVFNLFGDGLRDALDPKTGR